MENKTELKEIIQGILDFKVIPFFGSGMSAKFGMKTWGELINALKAELGTSTTDYLDVAQEYENRHGREALIERIKKETGTSVFKDGDMAVHYDILGMEPPIIYTTNWDKAIETAAENIGRERFKIGSLKDIVEAPHYENIVVKFHGDFESPENIVFTRNDFENRKKHEHPLDVIFREHLLGKNILFLGYSFSDENIDLLFSIHQKLYGTESLPKSYIIAFKDKFNQARADELAKKNIQTIVLDSVEELQKLIRELNQSVYEGDLSRQIKSMFKAHPSRVLIESDLNNLKAFINNSSNGGEAMAKKFRETLINVRLTEQMEKEVMEYLIQLIKSEIPMELRKAIVRGFAHILIAKPANAMVIGYELISLTRFPELNYDFRDFSSTDVMSEIESKLEPELTCYAIILFLVKVYKSEETASEEQLRRIFEMLRNCEWEKLPEHPNFLTKDELKELIAHFTTKHNSLHNILSQKPLFQRTRSQIQKEFTDMFEMFKNHGE